MAVANNNIEMEVKVENPETFTWKKVEECIELVFQEHPHATVNSEEAEAKNHDIHNLKKVECDDAVMDSEVYVYHQEGSKEIFDGHDRRPDDHKLTVTLDGRFDLDLANGIFLTLEKTTLPPITVSVDSAEVAAFEEWAGGKEGKLVVEVLFAEKSHATDREKYKIYKSGISGCARKRYTKNESIQFRNLKINHPSSLDKNSKIIIALYYLAADRRKLFREVLISKDLFIIEENKLINIDTEEALHQYFDLFGSEFMDKLPTPFRVNKNDRHGLNEEISNLEKYLIKKNKKFLNVVYLSFKFPHFCELYFRLPEVAEDQDIILAKRAALSSALAEAIKEVEELKLEGEKGELLCNYINPLSNLIFRININLRRVRIFMRKEFTQILSIVVSEDMAPPPGFAHFHSAKELKEFYLEYYSFARKCKSSEPFNKQLNNSSGFLQNPAEPAKKTKKAEDDEYHEEEGEEEDESEGDEESLDGYSGDKKAKKPNSLIKKLYPPKKPAPGNLSPKESKYPTRNKTRAQDCQESDNNESKRNALSKKIKEKEAQKKPTLPTLGGMVNPMNPMLPMPFQVIPQGGQAPMMGVFPMMQNLPVANPQKKDGQPVAGQKMMPMMPGIPGLQAIPGMQGMQIPGMGGISIAGMPGMPGGMIQGFPGMPGFGGMPMGMMPQQVAGKKQGKDGKDEPSGAKQGMPMMMPMMGQGMQMPMMGMQIPMMGGQQMMPGQFGMPMMGMQGMQGMQGIPIMQGPNGQLMMMQMMPQQLQQQMQAAQSANSAQNNAPNNGNASNSSATQQPQQGMPALIQGGVPMGMMMPGQSAMPGFQGMMMPQAMMGLGGSPLGVMGAPGGQPGSAQQGQNPLGGMGLGQMPMGFMIPQQSQQQAEQKGSEKNGQKAGDTSKKGESDVFPPPIDPNAAKNAIPSFLSPQGQFAAMIPPQNKDQKGQPTQPPIGMLPKMPMAPGQMPQIIGMPGMPGGAGGMVLTPEMFQQMQQGGQTGQLPQGIVLPQGMGQLPPNLPPGIMVAGGDPFAGMTPEQKQQIMMQQMKSMGFPGMPPQQQKKDDEKK